MMCRRSFHDTVPNGMLPKSMLTCKNVRTAMLMMRCVCTEVADKQHT